MVSHDVLKLAENKNIRLCVSPSIIEEVADVLARPKLAGRIEELRTTPDEIIESLLSIVEIVHPRHSFKVTADPDDMILECAVAAGAITLFLVILICLYQDFRDIPIVNPRMFLS